MLGVGGVLAEAVADVVFRPAPIDRHHRPRDDRRARHPALLGPFRGEAPVDRQALGDVLVALGRIAAERRRRQHRRQPADHRADGQPVAVDALVELRRRSIDEPATPTRPATTHRRPVPALFEPRGVLVTGCVDASGQVRLRLAAQPAGQRLRGAVFGTNLQGEEVLGIQTVADVAELPDGAIDLVVRVHAGGRQRRPAAGLRAKGVRAAFLTSAGYGEAARRAGGPRPSWSPSPTSSASCSPAPTGRASSARRRRCAPRSSPRTRRPAASPWPARAATSCPASSTSPGDRRRHLPRRVGGQRRGRVGGRLPRPTTPTIRRRRSASPTSRDRDGRALIDRLAGAARASRSCCSRAGRPGRGARRGQPHRALAADDKVFDGACRAAGITRRRRSRRRSRRRRRSPRSRRRAGPTSSC